MTFLKTEWEKYRPEAGLQTSRGSAETVLKYQRLLTSAECIADPVDLRVYSAAAHYTPVIEAALGMLLGLPISEALYVLDLLCPQPDACVATQLHSLDLSAMPACQIAQSGTVQLPCAQVLERLQSALGVFPEDKKLDFWLALSATWIKSTPRAKAQQDGGLVTNLANLADEETFHNFLRSELMLRLTMLF
jgi:hypothetical protein